MLIFCRSYQLFQLGNLEHLISFWCPFQEQLQSLVSAQEKAGVWDRESDSMLLGRFKVVVSLKYSSNLTISHNTLKLTKHLNIFKLQLLKIYIMKHTCYNKLIINSSGVRQSARNCRRHSEPAKQSNPCWKPAKGWQRKWRTRPCARQVFEIWEPVSFDIQEMLLFRGIPKELLTSEIFPFFYLKSIRLSVSFVFVYHSDFSTCTFFPSAEWHIALRIHIS